MGRKRGRRKEGRQGGIISPARLFPATLREEGGRCLVSIVQVFWLV